MKLVVTGINGEVEVVKNNVVTVSGSAVPAVDQTTNDVLPVRQEDQRPRRPGATALITGPADA